LEFCNEGLLTPFAFKGLLAARQIIMASYADPHKMPPLNGFKAWLPDYERLPDHG
jgi:hypothetical protein